MAIKVQGSTIIDDSRVLINTGNVGVGTTNPDTAVDSGNTGIVHAGIVTANKFYGDGSNLTGLTPGQVGALAGFTVREEGSTVGTGGSVGDINFVSSNLTATASGAGATITLTETPEFNNLSVTGVSTFNSDVRITSTGNLILDASGPQSVIFKDGGSDGLQFSYFTNGDNLNLQRSSDGFKVLLANRDSANIELYYNNSKKLETTNIGIAISNGTTDTATITGPSNLVIDPAVVGDNTGSVRIKGDLFVDGTTTQINSTTLEIADFVVGIASTATTDLLTDGAGIQIGPDNTFLYEHNGGTNPSLKSSENLNVAAGKGYQVNQVDVLNATTLGSGVTVSSLTSVGTLNGLTVDGDLSISDKITHSGDTNTAIRFPATDTIRLSTSGSPRLDVTPNGYILLGTTSEPNGGDAHAENAILLIQGRIGNTSDSGRINLQRGSSASDDSSIGSISFTDNSNNAFSRIETFADATPSNTSFPGRIVFSTTNDGASTPTEKLRITSGGFVGIKNTSPELQSSAARDLVIGTPGSGGQNGLTICSNTSGTNNIYFADASSGTGESTGRIVYSHADDSLTFHTVVQERLRITSTGRVGIGTDSPEFDFHLFRTGDTTLVIESDRPNTDENANPKLIFRQDGGVSASAIGMNFDSDGVGNDLFIANSISSGSIRFLTGTSNGYTNATEKVRIKSNGNFGIGSLDPDKKLVVLGGDCEVVIDDTNGSPVLRLRNNGSTGGTMELSSSNDLLFRAGGTTERLRINSTGNVGIGTDNPDTLLNLFGTGNTTIKVHNNSATAGTYSSLQLLTGGTGSSAKSEIRSLRMSNASAATNLALFTTTAGDTSPTERLRIGSTGYVGINTTAPSNRLHVKETNSNTIVGKIESSVEYAYLSLEDSSTTTGHVRVGAHVNDLVLRAGNDNHFRITSDGDITTSDSITAQTSNPFYENNRRVLEVHGGTTQGWLAVSATRTDTDAYVGGINFVNRHGQIDNHRFLGYIRLKSTHVNTGVYGTGVLKGQLEFATKPSSAGISTTTPDMVISPSGDIGIGTDNPARLLHLHESSSNGTFLSFTNTTTGTTSADGALIGIQDDESLLISNKENNHIELHTNNTERLRITSDGKVGVGEDNVQAHFHVAKNIADSDAINWTGSQLSVATEISGNSTANRATIYFAPYGSDNNYAPSAISASAGTNGASTLKFFTNASGNLTGQVQNYERLRITSAGLVGIGTNSPSGKLNIVGSDTQLLNLIQDSGDLAIRLNDRGVGSAYIKVRDNTLGSLSFDTGGSERLRIGPAGQIGLGGANYGSSGQVLTSNGSGSAPTWQTVSGGGDKIEEGNTSAEVIDTGSDGRFVVTTEGTERLRVTSVGRVGIATASPQHKLTVYNEGANAAGGILVQNITYSSNEDRPYLTVGTKGWTGATTNWNTFGFQHRIKSNSGGSPRITVDTTNGELLSITSGGFVGIGTDNPQETLEISKVANHGIRLSRPVGGSNPGNFDIKVMSHGAGNLQSNRGLVLNYGSNGLTNQKLSIKSNTSTVATFTHTSLGIGTDNPTYSLDLGKTPSTIRLVSEFDGTAIRVGAGGPGNDVTLIRVDGTTTQSDGESDSSQFGFSLKYMGSRNGNSNSLSVFSDNQAGTQVEAVTVLQDGKVGINSVAPVSALDVGIGTITTKGSVDLRASDSSTQKFSMVYNETTDSLDFVYTA